MLLAGCREDEARTIDGRQQTVGEALAIERDHLLPMPSEGFDLVEVSFARVDGLRRVRVRTNAYSVPVWPGTTVQVKLAAATVEIWHQGRCVARHWRSYGRHQDVLDLEHYLDVLERKPGAFAGSKPLEQWRRAGRWPTSYDRMWQALIERQGRQTGTRTMIELLQLGESRALLDCAWRSKPRSSWAAPTPRRCAICSRPRRSCMNDQLHWSTSACSA